MIKPFPLFVRKQGLIRTRSDKDVVMIDNLVSTRINDIGIQGGLGFGVGICDPKKLPVGMTPVAGTYDRFHENYGNYMFIHQNTSIAKMVYIPKFYYKIVGNVFYIKSKYAYANTAEANADGYALHRAFINSGIEQDGFFVFKGKAVKVTKGTGYVSGCILPGLPISTHADHNKLSDITASGGVNTYYATIDAVKGIDGDNGVKNTNSIFFVPTLYVYSALAILSIAQAQANSLTYCMWYNSTYNYPKGCNNNALSDCDDSSILYVSDGYSNCGKTGSGHPFEKTTHNGQANGVCDLNGLMYEVALGLTCTTVQKSITGATKANPCVITCVGHGFNTNDKIMINSVVGMTQLNDKFFTITKLDDDSFSLNCDSSSYTDYTSGGYAYHGTFYCFKDNVDVKTITSGNSSATDHWGSLGIANNFDSIVIPIKADTGGSSIGQRFGSGSNQVFDPSINGDGYKLTSLGLPKNTSSFDATGTNQFGKDYYYQYYRNEIFCLRCYAWSYSSNAGVFGMALHSYRSNSHSDVGFRACCFPD